MNTFLSIHQDKIEGILSTFDRMIFKGHLTSFFPQGTFTRYLYQQGVLLKEFKPYVTRTSQQLKTHAQQVAEDAKRPYIYLQSATTKRQGESKEDQARLIAARDNIEEGLVCVFSVVEPCRTFTVQGNHQTHRLEIVQRQSKCLHFYFYYLDAEFGMIHVRLQSWAPYPIQIYINGREWLARQLAQRGIKFHRYANSFTWIEDLAAAEELCERFAHRRWPRLLNAFARRVNPLLPTIRRAGFRSYYWVIDQCEYATDVMFKDRKTLKELYPELVSHSMHAFGADDVMRFLGRKLHGNFQGEVTTDVKRRPEGVRVRHRMKRNSLKMYDKWSILRVETTINNPREFKVLRVIQTTEGRQRRWKPMNKGVSNLWRYAQVMAQANHRYLEALAHVQPKGEAVAELDSLCRPVQKGGKRVARFNPVAEADCQLFAAVLAGEHALNGFRNKDLQAYLYETAANTPGERRRRSGRVSRLIAKLRGHGLVVKVKDSRLYRVSVRGYRIMSAALYYRQAGFPDYLGQPA